MEMKLAGDVAYLVTVLGMNVFLVFMLYLTKWRKSFISVAWTIFFAVVSVIMNMGCVRLFIPATSEFILTYVRTPMYFLLAVSIWTLICAAVYESNLGNRRRLNTKVAVSPEEK